MLTQDAIKQGLIKKADADKVADEVLISTDAPTTEDVIEPTIDYSKMTVKELIVECKKRNIKTGFNPHKQKLIDKLSA